MAKKKPVKNRKPTAKNNKAVNVETKPPDCQQAISFIDGCVAKAPLTRAQHIQAQQALGLIIRTTREVEQLRKELKEKKV